MLGCRVGVNHLNLDPAGGSAHSARVQALVIKREVVAVAVPGIKSH